MTAHPRPRDRRVIRGLRPTRVGFIGLLMLVAMLIASVNYASNMGFLLAFVLLAAALSSLLVTRQGLTLLQVQSVQPEPAFAGGTVRLRLEVLNPGRSFLRSLTFWVRGGGGAGSPAGPVELPPRSLQTVEVSLAVPRRGLYRFRDIGVLSVFPLGLFKRWVRLPVDREYVVYPRPAGSRPWPAPKTMWFENVEGFHFSGGDDFTGLRPYRLGESQRHIDWKAYARGRPLAVKTFDGGGSLQRWFDWDGLAGVPPEERLSQLTRWILEADQHGEEYGLRIPGIEIEPDSSSIHTRRCLRELALFQVSP